MAGAELCRLAVGTSTLLGRIKADGLVDEGKDDDAGHLLELLLGSHATIALLLNFVVNVFALAILCLKTIFFVQLNSSETRKVVERAVNYVFYKFVILFFHWRIIYIVAFVLTGIFLPLIIPPNAFQVAIWSAWVVTLCTLKMFQTLARDRLERLNASPSATPWMYFRVFSALLMVLSTDLLWMRFCMVIYKVLDSSMFLLLFFEPSSIAFETLQALMVHGFHLLELWNRHSADHSMECLGIQHSCSDFSFLLDMLTLLTALGHYLIIWWLHGLGFHLLDAALIGGIIKRVKGYIKLRKALLSLDVSLPDATSEELRTFDDECAICREPMSRAKKLSCNHLFHLSCLKSWLDQGLADVYSCPTCRRPLFLSSSRDHASSNTRGGSTTEQQAHSGLDEHRASAPAIAQPQIPPDSIWSESTSCSFSTCIFQGVGVDSAWGPHRPRPAADDASTSGGRSTGLDRVQLMMRHLASVGETYAHGALEDSSWNIWPAPSPSASPSGPSPSITLRNRRSSAGLRFRNPPPSPAESSSEMLAMADRVREVLPHIPDELIIQDLRRTNNVAMTVNNFLPS
ncbi:unnamed protein product [Spirodela intermedia]|uniref:Uncharacterized protein n=1 Tax=Spirodela intermedia TaxID=51605 RepID=A0A7I8J0E8_SPIIN|nr:unnamed protein product [Spirodela intermedia]CAA6663303.1 unnamed protein product [Spirodela intermedia]